MVNPSDLNPFANFKMGGLGTVGNIALVIGISLLIIILFGVLIYFLALRKSYNIKIHVFRLVGNVPTRIAIFRAREVLFGMAGDKLWRVAPQGLSMGFKVIKWLPVGKFQTAPHEFWYWIRQDGEWINFTPVDIDTKTSEMKIKFVQEDMRLQRLATEKLLEQRLMNKSFWEKYGLIIGYLAFFLIITIAMVIIFYQWSDIVTKIGGLVEKLTYAIEVAEKTDSLIPAR